MFGVADDVAFDAAAFDEEERRRTSDTARIARIVFWAAMMFAPAPYWLMVSVAFAPVSYFAALGLAHLDVVPFLVIPVLFCAFVWFWLARGIAAAIGLLDRPAARYVACAAVVAPLLAYAATIPGYVPLVGSETVWLTFVQLLVDAFGPIRPGVC
jgi:hypothetical protein